MQIQIIANKCGLEYLVLWHHSCPGNMRFYNFTAAHRDSPTCRTLNLISRRSCQAQAGKPRGNQQKHWEITDPNKVLIMRIIFNPDNISLFAAHSGLQLGAAEPLSHRHTCTILRFLLCLVFSHRNLIKSNGMNSCLGGLEGITFWLAVIQPCLKFDLVIM